MKIALIGPAYPYRGGIAHHMNMLARTLRKRGHHVDVITFSRQYPAFLYPGAFQEEGGEEFADIGSERLIDSMNPLTWYSTAKRLKREGYDVIVTRFWIPLFGVMYGTITQRVGGGKQGGRVLTIIDNLYPHESRPGDSFLRNYQFRYCNGAITQSGTVNRQFTQEFPSIPEVMLPHPVYENFGPAMEQGAARKILNLSTGPTLLFFGFVREYKGLDLLLEGMPEIKKRVPGVRLLVVGEFFDDAKPYFDQIERLGIDDIVEVHNIYVPNEEVGKWFSACDLLVLPYRSATNSGIVQIGYNFATPSVVTDVGSLSEVVIDGKTGFVVKSATPNELATAVEKAFEPGRLQELKEGIVEERKRYSWDAFAAGLEAFVEKEILSRTT